MTKTLFNMFLLDVNLDKTTFELHFFLYHQLLQNLQMIKDQ